MSVVWLIAALPLTVLGIALINLMVWPRGRPGRPLPESVSVLIPARNEAARIEATVRAALESRHPVLEVVVYDDSSKDETLRIVTALTEEDPRVRIVTGEPLPEGWVGKPHACHHLAQAARGEFLCFIDADTVLEPDGLDYLADVMNRWGAELLTAVPMQVTETLAERLVLPLLHLTYASWLPIPLVWLSKNPRFLAANGQLLVIRSRDYRRFGGHWAVRHEVVDDMALCRAAKQAGLRVVFADGARMARCRMYTSAREVWEGFSKNLYEGIGGQPVGLALVLLLNFGAFLLPWVTLALTPLFPPLLWPSLVGVGANALERALLAWRFEQSYLSMLFHPFAIGALLAIAINSWRWDRAGAIAWRGRVYGPRRGRELIP